MTGIQHHQNWFSGLELEKIMATGHSANAGGGASQSNSDQNTVEVNIIEYSTKFVQISDGNNYSDKVGPLFIITNGQVQGIQETCISLKPSRLFKHPNVLTIDNFISDINRLV